MLVPLSGKTFLVIFFCLEDWKCPGLIVTYISSWSALTEFTVSVSFAGLYLRAKTCSTSSSVLVEMTDSHPCAPLLMGPGFRQTVAKWLSSPQLLHALPTLCTLWDDGVARFHSHCNLLIFSCVRVLCACVDGRGIP